MHITTLIKSPARVIAPSELALALGYGHGAEKSDPGFGVVIDSAMVMVMHYTEKSLPGSEWQVKVVRPIQPFNGDLSPLRRNLVDEFRLPYGPVVSVESLVDDDTGDPISVDLKGDDIAVDLGIDRFTVNYTAGMVEVPQNVKLAVRSLAMFLHTHPGDCASGEPLIESGAASILNPVRRCNVVL